MDTCGLEYLVTTIDEAINRSSQTFKETIALDVDSIKINELSENLGELHGDIAFVKRRLMDEIEARKSKKFYQFWK